jgi:predicted outer membrane repeat protein
VVETAVISDCEFIENWSGRGAGALSIGDYTGGFQVTGCHFERNFSTQNSGGAILCELTGLEAPNTIENCTFLFNRLEGDGQGGAILVFANCTVRGNTFYGNSQIHPVAGGQAVAFFAPSSLENNIIAGSSGTEAVRANAGVEVTTDCNVFWENLGGNLDGLEMGPTDREVDPLFCDVPNEDFRLMKSSSCLPPNSKGCGLIGALGQGCGTVAITPESWARIKGRYATDR